MNDEKDENSASVSGIIALVVAFVICVFMIGYTAAEGSRNISDHPYVAWLVVSICCYAFGVFIGSWRRERAAPPAPQEGK
jgi:hypothetical protein